MYECLFCFENLIEINNYLSKIMEDLVIFFTILLLITTAIATVCSLLVLFIHGLKLWLETRSQKVNPII